jgi:hypothetical protein
VEFENQCTIMNFFCFFDHLSKIIQYNNYFMMGFVIILYLCFKETTRITNFMGHNLVIIVVNLVLS